MKNVKISVVIPFYNTPKELFKECIASVKKLHPFEIILVDDCSSDKALVKIAQDSGCIYLRTAFQSGYDGMPFNLGVKAAKGEYICRVDSDDILLDLPTEVTTEVYLGNVELIQIPPRLSLEELILAPRAIFNAMVIKKEVLEKYPLTEDANVFGDVLLMLRLLYNQHSFSRHKTVNYIYRKRAGSIQTSKPQFYHRMRLVQTVARFAQLENIDPKLSIYYLDLAMMHVKYGSDSLKHYKKANIKMCKV